MSDVNLTDDAKSANVAQDAASPHFGEKEPNQIIVKMEDVITIDPEATDVDLNHGRIGKIENLEPLVNLER